MNDMPCHITDELIDHPEDQKNIDLEDNYLKEDRSYTEEDLWLPTPTYVLTAQNSIKTYL